MKKIKKDETILLGYGSSMKAPALLLQLMNKANGSDNFRIHVFDSDNSSVSQFLPQISRNGYNELNFEANTEHILKTPGKDFIERIENGHYPGMVGYGDLTEIGRGMGDQKGSAGIPICGRATLVSNREFIKKLIKSELLRIANKRSIEAGHTKGIKLYLLSTLFGGFASGSREEILHLIQNCIDETKLPVEIYQIIWVPDNENTKDDVQSGSISFAGLTEISAASTDRFYTLRQHRKDTEPKIYKTPNVKTILISSSNNAAGIPLHLSQKELNSWIAQLIRFLETTPMGEQVSRMLKDFDDDAFDQTDSGEFRGIKSIGMSVINLDRDRLLNYSTKKISQKAIENMLLEVPEERIRELAKDYLRTEKLLQGKTFTTLSDVLLQRANGKKKFNHIERNRTIIAQTLEEKEGLDAIISLESSNELINRVRDDSINEVDKNARPFIESKKESIVQKYESICRNTELGPSNGAKFLSQVKLLIERMEEKIGTDLRDSEELLKKIKAKVDIYRNNTVSEVNQLGFISKRINKQKLTDIAKKGAGVIADHSSKMLELFAKEKALHVLTELKKHIMDLIDSSVDVITTLEKFKIENSEELSWLKTKDESYVCPLGYALINSNTIEKYYEKLLTDDEEELHKKEKSLTYNALNQLINQLPSFFDLIDQPEKMQILDQIANKTLQDKVEVMSVSEELLKLRSLGSDELRSFLNERDRESQPLQRLLDSDQIDNMQHQHYIRLLGIKGGDSNPVSEELNQYSLELKGMPFSPVDTGDSENVVLITLRSSIPVTSLQNYKKHRKTYEESAKQLSVEKYHTACWRRFIPLPGERLDDNDIKLFIVKAILIKRLEIRKDNEDIKVFFRTFNIHNAESQETVYLGSSLQDIKNFLNSRYDLLIEIWSLFWEVWFQKTEPEMIMQEMKNVQDLIHISSSRENGSTIIKELADNHALSVLNSQLNWVLNQLKTTQMFYYKN